MEVQTSSAPQNDRLNLSFVKYIYVHAENWLEMVKKWPFWRAGGGGYQSTMNMQLFSESSLCCCTLYLLGYSHYQWRCLDHETKIPTRKYVAPYFKDIHIKNLFRDLASKSHFLIF